MGIRHGGRAKGTPNKATIAKANEIAASGLTPLDYLLCVMRDETADARTRLDAAKAAAPFVHPKFATVDFRVHTNSFFDLGPPDWLGESRKFLARERE